jgi:glycogen debranching enzyme
MHTGSVDHSPDLLSRARRLLRDNYHVGFKSTNGKVTMLEGINPSPKMYSGAIWNWDTAKIAIVVAGFDPHRAQRLMETLIGFQADSGSIPIVTFFRGKTALERLFYRWFSSGQSTRITQPPVLPIAIERVYQESRDRRFLERTLHKAARYIDYLNDKRDPDGDHLVSVIHPYELGIDSTPTTDLLLRINLKKLPFPIALYHFQRIFKRYHDMGWDEETVLKSEIFDMEGVMFNSIHSLAQDSLARMFRELGDEAQAQKYEAQARLTEEAIIQNCWDEETHFFYDLGPNNDQLKVKTISGLMPLLLKNIPQEYTACLIAHLTDRDEFWSPYPIPSVAMNEPTFNPSVKTRTLWRGPMWVNTNWFAFNGLIQHGYLDLARDLGNRTIELVQQAGFWEHYDPITGRRGGEPNFGWSTLAIDIARTLEAL